MNARNGIHVHDKAQSRAPLRLALSGGGLRAAYFQQGGFLALAMRGELLSVNAIGTISGGTLAGVALTQARASVLSSLQSLAQQVREDIDLDLTIAAKADALLSRCANRDLRSETVLAPSALIHTLHSGWSPTHRLALELNRIFDANKLNFNDIQLAVGVHDLHAKNLVAVPVAETTDIGRLAAAAMSLPGLMESIVLAETGHACCDGGIDDKTAVRVLPGDDTHPVLVLDASASPAFDATQTVSPIQTLMAVTERHAEQERERDDAYLHCSVVRASLRAPSPPELNLAIDLVQHLRMTRTDLNGFSLPEQLSLIAIGFILTLHAMGESREEIVGKARRLFASRVLIRGKVAPYPWAPQFAEICEALTQTPSINTHPGQPDDYLSTLRVKYEQGLNWFLRGWSVEKSLNVILAKSGHQFLPDLRSTHPFFKTRAVVDLAWLVVLMGAGLLWTLYLLWILCLLIGARLEIPGLLVAAVAWVCASLTTLLIQGSGPRPRVGMRTFLAAIFSPLLLVLGAFAKMLRTAASEGDLSIQSLRFPQSTAGRIAGVLFHFPPIRARRHLLLVLAGKTAIVFTGIFNPFLLLTTLWPSLFPVDAWPPFAGSILTFFFQFPLNPALLALITLEVGFTFTSWLGRIRSKLGSSISVLRHSR